MPHQHRPLPVGHGDASWRLRLTGDPDQIVCTMSFDFPSAPDGAVVSALFTAWSTRLGPRQASVITLEGVHILYQSDSINQIVVDSLNTPTTGGLAASTVLAPINCAWLIRKRTAFAGRRNRGRMYFPGVREGDVDNVGAMQAAEVALMQTAVSGFMGDINPYGPELIHSCVCNAGDVGHPGAHDCIPAPPSPVLSLEVDDRLATQRRRLNR